MKLFKDFKIIECKCFRDYCDEWETNLEAEFYLANPETFTLLGKTFVVDRIVIENSFCGMNSSYTEFENFVFKPATAEKESFEHIKIPKEYLQEIAEIFETLESTKDKRLNGLVISDDIYFFLENGYEG